MASGSSAGQLVDGIIKSVSASVQAASNSAAAAKSCSHNIDGDGRLTLVDSRDVGLAATGGHHLSRELADQGDTPLTQPAVVEEGRNIAELGVSASGVEDHPSGPREPANMGADHPGRQHEPPTMSPEPLTVYEFREEDETVEILPLRGPRAGIEPPGNTIEFNGHDDDDDDDHDLMAFDDDLSPTVDRLAETVITYSRKKKLQPTENERQAERFSEAPSPAVTATTKKSAKRKSSVAGKRRRGTDAMELQTSEEPVKKKTRKRRTVDTDEVNGGKRKSKDDGLTTQAVATRSGRRSKKWNASVITDVRSKKLSVDDNVGSENSSIPASGAGKKRRRKSDLSKVESEKSSDCKEAPRAAVVHDVSTEQLVVAGDLAATDTDSTAWRKVRGRKTRTTRHSLRTDVENGSREDEDAGSAAEHQSATETDEVAVNAGSENANRQTDIVASGSLDELGGDVHQSESVVAADCLSDNTEILSMNDDADEGEYTRRSSPASYKSEEREPCLMLPAQHGNDDSSGDWSINCYLTVD